MKTISTPEPLVRAVDDNPDLLASIAFMLAAEGFRVKTYSDAEAFLQEDDPTQPGCLILDVQMEPIDGLELYDRLVRAGSRLPVIFLTAHGSIDMALDTLHSGAADFLQKPVLPEKLVASVRRALTLHLTPTSSLDPYALQKSFNALSDRELLVLRETAQGLSATAIGERHGLSRYTVEHYRRDAKEKAGVSSLDEIRDFLARADDWNARHGG